MAMMLVVVTLLSSAIGLSLIWVESSIGSVQRAEQAWVAEESMIAAIRIAAYERSKSQDMDCGEWPGEVYVVNDHEVLVICQATTAGLDLRAQVGERSLRARVAELTGQGDRWRLVGWEWNGSG
jgi:hypothetical protein